MDGVRLDKWLWAARFFKTRALAGEAVTGGKVHVGGERAKPARRVHVGDRIRLRRGVFEMTVEVRGLSERRGPAPEAQQLYEETDESRERRERLQLEMRAQGAGAMAGHGAAGGRPTKKDRRDLGRVRGRR